MTEISLTRLYALRAGYLILGGGLLATIWPNLLFQRADWPLMNSVVAALLAALSLLALLGLRYPLQMLPILLFELLWKTIWLTLVALPLWVSDQLDERSISTIVDCLVVLILVPLIPWSYVVARYIRAPGAPWRRSEVEPDVGPEGHASA